jgi:ParB family chromosome partitioning protein
MRRLRALVIDDPLGPSTGARAAERPVGSGEGIAADTRAGATDEALLADKSPGGRSHPVEVALTSGQPTEGRGLVASAVAAGLVDVGRLRRVALDAIVPNARQPRARFDDQALRALADSVAERGVLQPPVVCTALGGRFELIAGERRWRAARLAGLTEIEVLVKDADHAGRLQDAVMENAAREDLSPVEQANAYATLVKELGISREELGRRLVQSRVSISNHIRLLDLPDDVLDLLGEGRLTFAHGRALLLCDEHSVRRSLARRAVSEGWSVRQLEDGARRAGAPRVKRARAVSADHGALAQRLGEAVSRATGADIRVRAAGDDAYTFTIQGHDVARAIASRLGAEQLDQPL